MRGRGSRNGTIEVRNARFTTPMSHIFLNERAQSTSDSDDDIDNVFGGSEQRANHRSIVNFGLAGRRNRVLNQNRFKDESSDSDSDSASGSEDTLVPNPDLMTDPRRSSSKRGEHENKRGGFDGHRGGSRGGARGFRGNRGGFVHARGGFQSRNGPHSRRGRTAHPNASISRTESSPFSSPQFSPFSSNHPFRMNSKSMNRKRYEETDEPLTYFSIRKDLLSLQRKPENLHIILSKRASKFAKYAQAIAGSQFRSEQNIALFNLLISVYSIPSLLHCSQEKLASIYGIFFNQERFIFENLFNSLLINAVLGAQTTEDIIIFINFFKILIQVSIRYRKTFEPIIEKIENAFNKFGRLSEIQQTINDYRQEVQTKRKDDEFKVEKSVSPTITDLTFTPSNISNLTFSPWESLGEYRSVMIDLTKENFYLPFRNALSNLKQKCLDHRDLFLYENVQVAFNSNVENFSTFKLCDLFLTFQIRNLTCFKQKITTVDWKRSDRLQNRSLLILSRSPVLESIDAICTSCAVARSPDEKEQKLTIDFLNRGIVPVSLLNGSIKCDETYYMFEPTSSWSAVAPILQRLNRMDPLNFPKLFEGFILNHVFTNNVCEEEECKVEGAILATPEGSSHLSHHILGPQTPSLSLLNELTDEEKDQYLRVDHEQFAALSYALTHHLTLVNGAPGTGKTHYARELLRVLKSINANKLQSGPIVVITYTNHALDSILEGVLDIFGVNNIVRLGGVCRSDNPKIQSIKWKNYRLGREIREKRTRIATFREHLKHFYNLKQMCTIYKVNIKGDPKNTSHYRTVFDALNPFVKVYELFQSFKSYDIFQRGKQSQYNRYLNSKNKDIIYPLPTHIDYLNCWVLGEDHVQQLKQEYQNIFLHNRSIVDKTPTVEYKNTFSNLVITKNAENENEEEEEEAKGEVKVEASPNSIETLIHINQNIHIKKEEEEEEEESEQIFADEDQIEMTKVSFDDITIETSVPKEYCELIQTAFTEMMNSEQPPNTLMIKFLNQISAPLDALIKDYEKKITAEEAIFVEDETKAFGEVLKQAKLIGITSTVASVRKEALEIAKCEIVIIEEAGELTESMNTCILPTTMKRLIMVGDYQQLRPKVEHQLTKRPYHYDISLFERLVLNAQKSHADCLFTLSVQRRMHPEICQFVREAFYSNPIYGKINDAQSTHQLGIPFGLQHRVVYFMHNYEEQKESESRSRKNIEEAKYCATLVPFFISRGYKPGDITIISLYKGQRFEIQKQLDILFQKCRKDNTSKLHDPFGHIKSIHEIKVVVLDNFQGEENKIIIASLTRSDSPGFVEMRNRALVTLSRAREMLVVLGNSKVFGPDNEKSEMWRAISRSAQSLGPYSFTTQGLPIRCCHIHNPKETNTSNYISNPRDLLKFRFSFCKEKCNHLLPCGHRCKLPCHCQSKPPGEKEHDNYYCPERCTKTCSKGHPCTGRCGECSHKGECRHCQVPVQHTFPCGHSDFVPCHVLTHKKPKCRAECGKLILPCNHQCTLKCGHSGNCECHKQLSTLCERCNREIQYECGETPQCRKPCEFVLPCGHKCNKPCFQCNGVHDEKQCDKKCDYVFPCGHPCSLQCNDPTHNHQFCRVVVTLEHSFSSSLLSHGSTQRCSAESNCGRQCPHTCDVCQKQCKGRCRDKCIQRCECRCTKKCPECGERCRALSGERCAIFCEHTQFKGIKKPKKKQLFYVFHDNHYMLLEQAKIAVTHMYNSMMGISDGNEITHTSICRLTCPITNCQCKSPCIFGSWYFDPFNKEIEATLKIMNKRTEQMVEDQQIGKWDKIHWYKCPDCTSLFPVIFHNKDDLVIQCPHCK